MHTIRPFLFIMLLGLGCSGILLGQSDTDRAANKIDLLSSPDPAGFGSAFFDLSVQRKLGVEAADLQQWKFSVSGVAGFDSNPSSLNRPDPGWFAAFKVGVAVPAKVLADTSTIEGRFAVRELRFDHADDENDTTRTEAAMSWKKSTETIALTSALTETYTLLERKKLMNSLKGLLDCKWQLQPPMMAMGLSASVARRDSLRPPARARADADAWIPFLGGSVILDWNKHPAGAEKSGRPTLVLGTAAGWYLADGEDEDLSARLYTIAIEGWQLMENAKLKWEAAYERKRGENTHSQSAGLFAREDTLTKTGVELAYTRPGKSTAWTYAVGANYVNQKSNLQSKHWHGLSVTGMVSRSF